MKLVTRPFRELGQAELATWTELQEADPAVDNPFFRPEYASAVDRVRGAVEVALLYDGRELRGLLPFERDSRDVGRPVTWRVTDAHGLVARADLRWNPIELLRAAGLRAWHFDHLVASQKPFEPFHHWVDESPYIDLSAGYASYRADRIGSGSSLIRQAERKRRKLEREVGPLRFEYHTHDPAVLAALLRWKSAQIARWELYDVFRVDWVVDLVEALCRIETPGFSGVMSAMYAGDALAAVHLGLRSHGAFCSWIPTLNDRFRSYSPGLLIHVELAKLAAERGVRRIDLGRGSNALKRGLASGATGLAIGSVTRWPIASRVSAASHRLKRALPIRRLKSFPPAVAVLRITRKLRNRLTPEG